jgi:hypothetical protein
MRDECFAIAFFRELHSPRSVRSARAARGGWWKVDSKSWSFEMSNRRLREAATGPHPSPCHGVRTLHPQGA